VLSLPWRPVYRESVTSGLETPPSAVRMEMRMTLRVVDCGPPLSRRCPASCAALCLRHGPQADSFPLGPGLLRRASPKTVRSRLLAGARNNKRRRVPPAPADSVPPSPRCRAREKPHRQERFWSGLLPQVHGYRDNRSPLRKGGLDRRTIRATAAAGARDPIPCVCCRRPRSALQPGTDRVNRILQMAYHGEGVRRLGRPYTDQPRNHSNLALRAAPRRSANHVPGPRRRERYTGADSNDIFR